MNLSSNFKLYGTSNIEVDIPIYYTSNVILELLKVGIWILDFETQP
jgi:hypothetical protein